MNEHPSVNRGNILKTVAECVDKLQLEHNVSCFE